MKTPRPSTQALAVRPGQRAGHAPASPRRAFSLVEVALSLGIVSFVLLSLVALLPIGLNGVRTANEEAFAAQTLKAISAALQGSTHPTSTSMDYSALAPFNTQLQWKVGSAAQAGQTFYIGSDGLPTATRDDARLVACVKITPPLTILDVGHAYVGIAWPAAMVSDPVSWSGNLPNFGNAQGVMESVVYFSPESP